MQRHEINQLARRLEVAGAQEIADNSGPLVKEIERLARHSLYMALRVWENFANQDLKRGDIQPKIIAVAKVVEREFEGRATQYRSAVKLPEHENTHVTRPIKNRVYEGKIVAQTPDYFVQHTGKSFVLHQKESLTIDPAAMGDDVKIRYPFKAIGGIGLVTQREEQLTRELSEFQAHKAHDLKQSEKEFDL